MNFASFPYLVFLALSILLYYSLGKRVRPLFLLLASYFFYAFFGFGFVALMIFTTVVTFISARLCYAAKTKSGQQFFLLAGLCIDLAVFILFKYLRIIDTNIMNWPGWGLQKLLIPVGISFYTFKTLGYCIDVYKRKYAPEPSFLYYALSVSFFPQLIAGPIEKSYNIIARLKTNKTFSATNFSEGSKLILWGVFKKIVIADTLALIINPVYANIGSYGGAELLLVAIAFAYQVYADFSGYSDIAIGSAKCLGVELPFNFNKPFQAKNIRDFWARWHASLTAWLREYIYIPLGGNRVGKARWLLHLFFIFILMGLWHGANWNYIAWGITAYLWLVADAGTTKFRNFLFKKWNLRADGLGMRIGSYAIMVLMVASLGIFFRPQSIQDSFLLLQNIFKLNISKFGLPNCLILAGAIALLELLQYFQKRPKGSCFDGIGNDFVRISVYLVMILTLILVSGRADITFQYFQF